jgi:hypothetical protein
MRVLRITRAYSRRVIWTALCRPAQRRSEQTFSQWRQRKPEFSEAIKEAEGAAD